MENYIRKEKICDTVFGGIWKVEHIEEQKIYALKSVQLSQESQSQSQKEQNPLNEVKLLESLQHPNIIKYNQTFIEDQKLHIIMEYANNGDLKDRVTESKQLNEYIEINKVVNWFTQICLSLHYLYEQNILHRDIKVQNIFMTDTGLIKLGDFGISKKLDKTNDFAVTSLGTPYYLAPEICQNQQYGHKADIWMLGCTLYELCTLEKPFTGEFFELVNKIQKEPYKPFNNEDIPAWLQKLIDKMLQKDPAMRPDIIEIIQLTEIQQMFKYLKDKYEEYKDLKLPIKKQWSNSRPPMITEIENDDKEQLNLPKQSQSTTNKKLAKNSIYNLIEQARRQSPSNAKQNQIYSRKPPIKMSNDDIINQNYGYINNKMVSQSQDASPIQMHSFSQISDNQKAQLDQDLQLSQHRHRSSINLIPVEQQKQQQSKQQQIISQSQQNQQLQFQQAQIQNQQIGNNQQIEYESQQQNINLNSKQQQQSQQHISHKLKPQRPISINTAALEQQYSQKKATPGSQKSNSDQNVDQNNVPTKKVQPNQKFNFAHAIFNPNKAPSSPNRTILFSDFLRNKLGEEKFMKMKNLLEGNSNPMKILDENKQMVQEIIGEENMDCIKIFKFLITSSVTPPSSHFRTKSMQAFDEGLRFQAIVNHEEQLKLQQQMQQNIQMHQQINNVNNLNNQNISPKISPIYSQQMSSVYKNQLNSISPKIASPLYYNSQIKNYINNSGGSAMNIQQQYQQQQQQQSNSSGCVSPINNYIQHQQQQQQNNSGQNQQNQYNNKQQKNLQQQNQQYNPINLQNSSLNNQFNLKKTQSLQQQSNQISQFQQNNNNNFYQNNNNPANIMNNINNGNFNKVQGNNIVNNNNSNSNTNYNNIQQNDILEFTNASFAPKQDIQEIQDQIDELQFDEKKI